MARPELGTKRVCPTTGRKFYDLNRSPIISPYTGQIVTIAAPVLSRSARAEVVPAKVSEDDPDVEVLPDVELVALEEADEDPAAAKVVEDDIEVEDDVVADDTFLEEEEDEDADVTDLIGDGIEDDEEP